MEDQTFQPIVPYREFLRREGIPVYEGYSIEDVRSLTLDPWARLEGFGAYINLEGSGGTNNAYVCEIPAGQSIAPERHLFEKFIYVLRGQGETAVWSKTTDKRKVAWRAGSLFAIPVNAWHQFSNLGSEEARFVAVTNAPLVIDLYHNLDFVFNCDYSFSDRFDSRPDYFEGKGRIFPGRQIVLETNLVADAANLSLYEVEAEARGKGALFVMLEMAQSTLTAHIAEWEPATYQKAHYHGAGAHLLMLKGSGYSLMWPYEAGTKPFAQGNGKQVVRVDWREGSLFAPPDMWFHQHFNSGTTLARHLALRWGSRKYRLSATFDTEPERTITDIKRGGTQIDLQDADPEIERIFSEECRKAGSK